MILFAILVYKYFMLTEISFMSVFFNSVTFDMKDIIINFKIFSVELNNNNQPLQYFTIFQDMTLCFVSGHINE